ncbi:hypothetical protein ABT332_13250 [Saccharomonospora azurea]|uniref:hypothetical protein n=1 Tax=Saccharomonospora azurea TaxID=40988 RepID=UPI003328F71B
MTKHIELLAALDIGDGINRRLEKHVTFADGTTALIPVPFTLVGRDLFIAPAVEPDGNDRAVRINLTSWFFGKFTHGSASPKMAELFVYGDDARKQVGRMCVDFDADPTIDWSAPAERLRKWRQDWLEQNQS